LIDLLTSDSHRDGNAGMTCDCVLQSGLYQIHMHVYISATKLCPPLLCKSGSCISALLDVKQVEAMLHELCNEHKGSSPFSQPEIMLELPVQRWVCC